MRSLLIILALLSPVIANCANILFIIIKKFGFLTLLEQADRKLKYAKGFIWSRSFSKLENFANSYLKLSQSLVQLPCKRIHFANDSQRVNLALVDFLSIKTRDTNDAPRIFSVKIRTY